MTAGNRILGKFGEEKAADHLTRMGYEILEHNVRTPCGELDLIAAHAGWTVFVEVKTRRSRTYGLPEEAITSRKKSRLLASAQYYLQQHDLSDAPWRIDVVAIEVDTAGSLHRIEVFENAVQA